MEIEKAVISILAESGVTFTAEFDDEVTREDWVCDQFTITLENTAGVWKNFDYYQGVGYRRDGVTPEPSATDVLYCLISDANCGDESFSDFCSNFGYDEDSRRACKTWLQCKKTKRKLLKLFGQEGIDKLAVALECY